MLYPAELRARKSKQIMDSTVVEIPQDGKMTAGLSGLYESLPAHLIGSIQAPPHLVQAPVQIRQCTIVLFWGEFALSAL